MPLSMYSLFLGRILHENEFYRKIMHDAGNCCNQCTTLALLLHLDGPKTGAAEARVQP